MQQTRRTPTFNMKAVVQETGLKPDTLRAWERRYDLPNPDRTEGGHRLYSQRDIDILKWLLMRQDEGLSISHAAELWHRLESEGQNPLLATQPAPSAISEPILSADAGLNIDKLREAWIAACKAFDEPAAEKIAMEAFSLYPPEYVCFELLQKGVAQIGDGWYEGESTVQQEHFASALALRRLEAMVAATPLPTRPGRILMGCPPDEEHTFSPLLLTLLMRRKGWEVIYLGANVPIERVASTLGNVQPHLAVFSAQQLKTAASLMDVAQTLREQETTLAFGGRIFNEIPDLRRRIYGHFLGTTLEEAVQLVEQALTQPLPAPEIELPSDSYMEALDHFQEKRAVVEVDLWQLLQARGMPYTHMLNANGHLARGILSALKLGDMAYLGSEIDWAEGLVTNFDIPAAVMPLYMHVYYESASQQLDQRGQPVVDWLSQFRLAPADLQKNAGLIQQLDA